MLNRHSSQWRTFLVRLTLVAVFTCPIISSANWAIASTGAIDDSLVEQILGLPEDSKQETHVSVDRSIDEAKVDQNSLGQTHISIPGQVVKAKPSESITDTTTEATIDAALTVGAGAGTSKVPQKEESFVTAVSLGLPAGAILGTVEQDVVRKGDDAPIIIDNDEVVETRETIKYQELATDSGKTKVLAGAQFPVVVVSQISSKTAKKGDPVEARLKYDLKIGDRLVAQKGAVVNGHLNYVLKARSAMHSLVSTERWYRNSGCLGVSFDEIVNDKGEHIPLVATPAQSARIVKNKGEGRELGVNHCGQVTGPWSQQLRYKAIRIGLNAALAPAGVFSFGAMPVALGIIGAANPSFAFMKPVGLNVRHRRIKGFAWGFLSGVPGSWIIEDTVVKGQEAILKPGDEFLAEFKEEFTGEPMTDASLINGGTGKVHGEVLPEATKAKNKAK